MIITTAHPLFHWQGLVVQQELHPTLFSFSQQFSLYNEIPTNNIMKTDVPIYKINHIDLSEVALTWKFQKNFFSRSITFSKTITMIFLRLQSRIHYPNILLLIAAIFVTRFHNHISFVIVCTTYAMRLRTDGMMAKLEKISPTLSDVEGSICIHIWQYSLFLIAITLMYRER